METKSIRCLISDISRFIHLVSSETLTLMHVQKDFERVAVLIKNLKPFLDEVVDEKITPDDFFLKECEKLDCDVKEATDYIENWSSNASKILSVWQTELVLTKIRSSSFEICRMLCRLLRASLSSSSLAGLHNCMQELQNWQPNRISTHIEQALRDQNDKSVTRDEHLIEIMESIGLISNQEFLEERTAVEKERFKSQANHTKGNVDIHQVNSLINLIHDFMLENGYLDSIHGFTIPSCFRCPLSLELMLDPVIVSSGQTFERVCIQEWIDQGLNTCPKTGEPLSHTNVIPNYTMKAMIESWFEENNHSLHYKSHSNSMSSIELGDLYKMQPTEDPFGLSRTQSDSSVISYSSKSSMEMRTDNSFASSEMGSDETTTFSNVEKLVEDLKSHSNEVQTSAAYELRLLAKHSVRNRNIIGKCNAIGPLVALMYSEMKIAQEHAVTTLLNLSINDENKPMIAEARVIEPFIHVLKSGNNAAKENCAATIFSLSVAEDFKVKIGQSQAVKGLVNLLGNGTIRGKKDAATALFNLSITHENKARIVKAGAVKYLVELLDQDSGMVDKAIALLSNLATVSEGRSVIVREGGIALIVEILDCGSRRGKENAASILLQLCLNSNKFCSMVIQEGAVPPLVSLSQTGTPRAREKAQQLLSHFRNQRETAASTGRRRP